LNFLILTALKSEAKPIISYFDLNKDPKTHIYSNKKIFLLITGVGEKNVINKLKSLELKESSWSKTVILNIGIAGGNQLDTKIGNIYLVNSIFDQQSEREYFPDFIIKTSLEEMPMTTVSQPLIDNDCSLRGLVDMEGGSIVKTMSPFVPPHRLIFLKIISDHFKSSDLKEISVASLIEAQIKNIHGLIKKLEHPKLSDRLILNHVEKKKIKEITTKYNLTKTQEYELLEMAESHKKIFNNLTKLESHFTVKPKNKKERNKLFESLRESIPS